MAVLRPAPGPPEPMTNGNGESRQCDATLQRRIFIQHSGVIRGRVDFDSPLFRIDFPHQLAAADKVLHTLARHLFLGVARTQNLDGQFRNEIQDLFARQNAIIDCCAAKATLMLCDQAEAGLGQE